MTSETIELRGISELDLADLRAALSRADLNPQEVIEDVQKQASSGNTRAHEPATLMLVIGLAKVAIPAMASVLTAWLASRKTRHISLRDGDRWVTLVERGAFSKDIDVEALLSSKKTGGASGG